jgi:hypothetical protein
MLGMHAHAPDQPSNKLKPVFETNETPTHKSLPARFSFDRRGFFFFRFQSDLKRIALQQIRTLALTFYP